MAPSKGTTNWSVEYDTLRRERLFRNPPRDRTAYPALEEAVRPHVDSFNALFDGSRVLEAALADIGTKTFVDGVRTSTATTATSATTTAGTARRKNRLSVRITELFLEKAVLPASNKFSTRNREIYPAECRERHATYRGKLRARLEYRINNGEWKESVREMGQVPLMLRTNRCHLEKCTPLQLVERKEESEELGGYFIVNGNEKLIRLLIVSKRNFPMAIVRNSFVKRGPSYSKFGVQIRSVRPDQTSQTNVLHYLTDGNVTFRFSWRKNEYLVPVVMVLKALVETNDRDIFERLVGREGSLGMKNTFVTDRAELLLRTYKAYGLHSQAKARAFLGEKFRLVLGMPETVPDEAVGTEFLRKIVLPHLGNHNVTPAQDSDKFNLLIFMIRKLYTVVAGDCAPDNPDAISNQEVLLGGFLYGMILKERLEEWLRSFGPIARDWCQRNEGSGFTDPKFERDFLSRIVARTNENIGGALEYFLSTGNLVSPTGLDLQQPSGYTVMAEKINFYRFISHFRMIHRGSFFAQLKTTTVRKLLPESWGFLCPVHTPDGAPCGLLNHLAHKCLIATSNLDVSRVPEAISHLGMTSESSVSMDESVTIQLDGRILGYCSPKHARVIADTLRYWKTKGQNKLVPLELEVGYVPNSNGGQYPGVYLFSQSARMLRPVKYLPLDTLDYVGPFEQPYMEIVCMPSEITSGVSTHVEYDPTHILSILANLTPFSDFNQSPRNMYQCQMSKQAMGTPGSALEYRTDNKLYQLQTGQTPVVRPPLYNEYGFDNFPNGMNAVVAVISYTGYDMDDAMIINKSAHERGFGYGTIYKTKVHSLDDSKKRETTRGRAKSKRDIVKLFGFAPGGLIKAEWRSQLDEDGLPHVGVKVGEGSIVAAWHTVQYDPASDTYFNLDKQTHFIRYKDGEEGYVDSVRVLGAETGGEPCQAISVKYRVPRKPIIGDKFSSRHGQKGVCSQLWPSVDMPFSESGIQPDIIINPHAFPSRMTIGMFVESLAGKAGALHGLAQDSTPFRFSEDYAAGDFFGEQLRAAGYNFHGNEPMYSGITGREFAADIYLGVVYYQRLRHMVNDKFQVRTTGPVNALTGQPVKGRAKGGGIRVGEMERDALLAHGAAFLLQDRLMNCSDAQRAWICRACGSFVSTQVAVSQLLAPHKNPALEAAAKSAASTSSSSTLPVSGAGGTSTGGLSALGGAAGIVRCRRCAREAVFDDRRAEVWEDGSGKRFVGGDDTTVVAVPGVLKYLDVELAAMGVKMTFRVNN